MDISKEEYIQQNCIQYQDEFFSWFLEQEAGEHTVEVRITNSKGKVLKHKVTAKIQRLLQQNLHDAEIYEGQKYKARTRYERKRPAFVNGLTLNDRD